ncbi:MAG: PspC domain-containing protein [Thermosphaera sp.]
MSEIKKLYKSRSNRVLCGVCGGIGHYVNIDPTIVRLLWVLITILSPPAGLILYVVACIIVPDEPVPQQSGVTVQPSKPGVNVEGAVVMVVGIILAVLGGLMIFSVIAELWRSISPWGFIGVDERFKIVIGIVLMVAGIALVLKQREMKPQPTSPPQQSL